MGRPAAQREGNGGDLRAGKESVEERFRIGIVLQPEKEGEGDLALFADVRQEHGGRYGMEFHRNADIRQVLLHDLTQIIRVVNVDVVKLRYARIDIPRHA